LCGGLQERPHAFGKMMGANDAFATWFLERAQAIHGLDPSVVKSGPRSELVVDSEPASVLAG
jgi:hypothetical protein